MQETLTKPTSITNFQLSNKKHVTYIHKQYSFFMQNTFKTSFAYL